MTGEWLTYERRGKRSFTRPSTEFPTRNGWVPRLATESEIAEEVARRLERDAERKRIEEFQARPEYRDAVAIAKLLEWVTPETHPLDRLTPAEWAEFRKRLGA